MGFSRKKLYPPPLCGYRFLTPWISSQIYRDPPGNPCFFLNFWRLPWNSNDYDSTSLEFSIDILNRGVTIFFWKSPILEK